MADHLRRARGISAGPEDIHITAGTGDALLLIALTLNRLHGGAEIAVEDPGYPAARRALRVAGAQLHAVGVTGDAGIAVDDIPTSVRAVLTTPSHQYPLGGAMAVQDRLKLLSWARDHDAVVLEDDYDSEFRYGRPPLPALATLSTGEPVATIGSFSKVLTPALRAGYVYAAGPLGEELARTRRDLGASVSYLQQKALAGYIDSGGLARHIARVRREYRHRRDLLTDRLSRLPGTRVAATSGGLHAVIRTPRSASQLAAELREKGAEVALLSSYYSAGLPEAEDALVLGYGHVSSAELTQVLHQLQELISR